MSTSDVGPRASAFWDAAIPDPASLHSLPLCGDRRPSGGGVYFLVDGDGRIQYVGQCQDFAARLAQHRRDPRKSSLARVILFPVVDKQERLIWETIYIAILRPPQNSAVLLRVSDGRLSEIRFGKGRGKKRKGPVSK